MGVSDEIPAGWRLKHSVVMVSLGWFGLVFSLGFFRAFFSIGFLVLFLFFEVERGSVMTVDNCIQIL